MLALDLTQDLCAIPLTYASVFHGNKWKKKQKKKSSVLLFIVLYVILEIGEQMQRLMGYLYNFIMKTMWFLVEVGH